MTKVFQLEEAKFYKEGAGTRKEASFRKGIPECCYSIINRVSLYLNLYFVNNDSRTKFYVLAMLFHLFHTFSGRVFFLHPLKPIKILFFSIFSGGIEREWLN